jgi:hypothetical protein
VFEYVLKTMRERVRTRHYVMTVHAEEEMDADGLSIFDVENAILSADLWSSRWIGRGGTGSK